MFLLLLQDLQNEQGGVALGLEICIWERPISNLIRIMGLQLQLKSGPALGPTQPPL